eukprot:GHVR01013044.1.p1 GENE.GHVR01013044.1~~GHVR01013044.1.p1  ORF type:complete len:291 (+),score=7.32 GHVR01013044.1:413-1285(+)
MHQQSTIWIGPSKRLHRAYKVNLKKSNIEGKYCKFANFHVTDKGISLQEGIIQDMQILLETLVTRGTNPKTTYARVKGKLMWNGPVLPPLTTDVIESLQTHLNNRESWSTPIPINKESRKLIHRLLVVLANYAQFQASLPTSTIPMLVVDASATHWGGFFFPGGGRPILTLRGTHGSNTPQAANVRELEAVLRGLQHIKQMVPTGTALQVLSDYIHVVHSLRESVPSKKWKSAYTSRGHKIRAVEKEFDLRIKYLFCPGEANSADGLSRPDLTAAEAQYKATADWRKRNM